MEVENCLTSDIEDIMALYNPPEICKCSGKWSFGLSLNIHILKRK